MLDEQLLKLIGSTSEILELEDSVVEKDYYTTQVIHALSDLENEYFRLVFAGGTCLAKAHKIVKRMSEDCDFKIQVKKSISNISKSQMLRELKTFRNLIASKLELSGLTVGQSKVRNEGQYSWFEINYTSAFNPSIGLRPHILIEFTVSDVRLPIEFLNIETLIEDTLDGVILFPKKETGCISINETAIEKWVGLTRRIMAIERGYHHDDKTLIRHVYDLNAIRQANKINDDFFWFSKNSCQS